MSAWYVVATHPRAEKRAEVAMMEAGLDAYMPFITRWAKSGRRKYRSQIPLFRGYVFVFVPAGNFHEVHACDGVAKIVGVQGYPVQVPMQQVKALRQAQLLGEFDETKEGPPDPFQTGDQVKVAVGNKFADWPGKVLRMTEEGRVLVLLRSMLGKEHEHTFGPDELQAA